MAANRLALLLGIAPIRAQAPLLGTSPEGRGCIFEVPPFPRGIIWSGASSQQQTPRSRDDDAYRCNAGLLRRVPCPANRLALPRGRTRAARVWRMVRRVWRSAVNGRVGTYPASRTLQTWPAPLTTLIMFVTLHATTKEVTNEEIQFAGVPHAQSTRHPLRVLGVPRQSELYPDRLSSSGGSCRSRPRPTLPWRSLCGASESATR